MRLFWSLALTVGISNTQQVRVLPSIYEQAVTVKRAVLDGEFRAYVLKIVPGCYRVDLSLERMDIINGKSEEAGGGVAFVSEDGAFSSISQCEAQSGQTQVERDGKSSLTLKNVVIENNYSKDGAGIKANGLSLADISGSTFLGNGYYINPSLAIDNPGGSGAAHLDIQAERLIFDSNVLAEVGLPYGGEIPSVGSYLFNVAIALNSLGDPASLGVDGCDSPSVIRGNDFAGIVSTSVVQQMEGMSGYTREVIPYRDLLNINGNACTEVTNNNFKNLDGASISFQAGKVSGNTFENIVLTQGLSVVGLNSEIIDNTFSGFGFPTSSVSWASDLGSQFEGAVIRLEFGGPMSTDSRGNITRNSFRNMIGSVEVRGSGKLVGNVFSIFKIVARLPYRATVLEIEIILLGDRANLDSVSQSVNSPTLKWKWSIILFGLYQRYLRDSTLRGSVTVHSRHLRTISIRPPLSYGTSPRGIFRWIRVFLTRRQETCTWSRTPLRSMPVSKTASSVQAI